MACDGTVRSPPSTTRNAAANPALAVSSPVVAMGAWLPFSIFVMAVSRVVTCASNSGFLLASCGLHVAEAVLDDADLSQCSARQARFCEYLQAETLLLVEFGLGDLRPGIHLNLKVWVKIWPSTVSFT